MEKKRQQRSQEQPKLKAPQQPQPTDAALSVKDQAALGLESIETDAVTNARNLRTIARRKVAHVDQETMAQVLPILCMVDQLFVT